MHRTVEPLDAALNDAIMIAAAHNLPQGFDLSDNAPATYLALKAHLDAGRRMLVWPGGSQQTIYGSRIVNYAFRAWHDLCHYHGRFLFTLEGEAAACAMQSRQLVRVFGDCVRTRRWRTIMEAEIVGQGLYLQRHRRFPEDQRKFISAYLIDPKRALNANW